MKDEQLEHDAVDESGESVVAEVGEAMEKPESTKGHVLDVAPGCLAIELPSGYIVDDEVYTTAVVREMTGYEEDILAASGPIATRLSAIIGNCLVQLGPISDKVQIRKAVDILTAQDRMVILIAIRRVSLGDFYDVKVTCPRPECKVEQNKTLDLKEIGIVPMPDRMSRERTDSLPSGKVVKWHVIRASDEEWLTSQKKKKDDRLTLGLLSRVDAVDDAVINRGLNYKGAMQVLKSLSTKDRNALRDLFDREEGSIDTTVEFDCEECNHTWQGQMDVGQASFFFPSAK